MKTCVFLRYMQFYTEEMHIFVAKHDMKCYNTLN